MFLPRSDWSFRPPQRIRLRSGVKARGGRVWEFFMGVCRGGLPDAKKPLENCCAGCAEAAGLRILGGVPSGDSRGWRVGPEDC
ncbi:MAG: hypothetical protein RL215_1135 [Planctomycetota bacterium]